MITSRKAAEICRKGVLAIATAVLFAAATDVQADRIKDLASIEGVRPNQLVGYGLVAGLDGTGDQTMQIPFAEQSVKNMLTQMGLTYTSTTRPQMKNVAAVMVHASLPPFAKAGQAIDVTVSSIGNAKSLRGGTLIMTPLKGADGRVYAIAQGSLVISGFGGDTKDGSRLAVNVMASGRIPNGATVEQEVNNSFAEGDSIVLALRQNDFTTAARVAKAINSTFGHNIAVAEDGSSVRVLAPSSPTQRVAFSSDLENVVVEPGEAAARVVINSRTGTVIIGSNVRVTAAAVTHGSVTVSINEAQVSQPAPGSLGQTVVPTGPKIAAQEQNNKMFLFAPGVALDDIVRAVNGVGISPGDLVAILQALKEAGALHADLVII